MESLACSVPPTTFLFTTSCLAMRRFVCAVLTVLAVPAFAQDAPRAEDGVEFEIETEDDGPVRFHIERDGPRILFRGDGEERIFDLNTSELEFDVFNRMGESPFALFRDGGPARLFDVLGSRSVSQETRERMRDLQAQSRELAMQVRRAEGAERQDAERQLDAVLGELFDVRGQARQEEADALRERARELVEEANEKEESLRDRAARREALIEARRAELLGTSSSDW